jgi:hypothetical protein
LIRCKRPDLAAHFRDLTVKRTVRPAGLTHVYIVIGCIL